MRHRKSGRHLNRTSSHLKVMLLNMACSLFKYEQIKTTLAKAKEIRRVVEPLITYSKIDTHVRRRSIFFKIHDKFIVNKLFTNIGPFFLNRSGGYVRLIKSGYRTGDKSKMAYVQLVDRNNKKISKQIDKK